MSKMRKITIATAAVAVIAIIAAATFGSTATRNEVEAQQPSGICGRNQVVQTAILNAATDATDCADVTSQQLARVTGTLDFSGGTLTTLTAADLAGLSGVSRLDLSENNINLLPSHVFDDLTGLREIDLSGNSLAALPPEPFHHNAQLEFVDASDNAIAHLQEGPFIHNTVLRTIDLSGNAISYLSGTEFTPAAGLRKLDLSQNSLQGLGMGIFEGLEELEELYLANNPGAPFSFDLQAFDLGANAFEVAVGGGAPPFDMTGNLLVTGGAINFHTVNMGGGGRNASPVITVSHSSDSAATVWVTNAAFSSGVYSGIAAANGAALAVSKDGPTTGICSRTREIQDEIMDLLQSSSCQLVTDAQLASISRPFAVVGTDMRDLRPNDLAGLTNVQDLYLYGNQIAALPDNLFTDAGSFDRVLIQDNPGANFPLTVRMVDKPNNQVAAAISHGTPFLVNIKMAITGGTLGEATPHIGAGSAEGDAVTVYPTGSMADVRVTIESATFEDTGLLAYSYYDGFEIQISNDDATAVGQQEDVPAAVPEPTTVAPVTVPGKPTDLRAEVTGDNVVLTWTAPQDSIVTGYQILRRVPSDGERELVILVANTGNTDTTYLDASVTRGKKHNYRVKALNSAGAGPRSNYVNARP